MSPASVDSISSSILKSNFKKVSVPNSNFDIYSSLRMIVANLKYINVKNQFV